MVFIGYPSRRREVPFRLILPNLLTTVALCSGMASIHFSMKASAAIASGESAVAAGLLRINDWEKAMAAIFVAAIFDMLDGRAARLLKAQSPFGAMLDSLSDFLAFGVAPGVLLHQWTLKNATFPKPVASILGEDADAFALAAVMTFVLCSALRLARFTAAAKAVRLPHGVAPVPAPSADIRPNPLASKFFVGMPTPAAAAAVLIPPMMENSSKIGYHVADWLVILFTFLIAGLMVGRQPMFSFKKVRVPRRLVVPLLVTIGLVVVMAAKHPWLTGVVLAGGYLLTTPFSIVSYRKMQQAAARAGESHAPSPAAAERSSGIS